MKTRWLLSGLLLGSVLSLPGCGAGQYKIPNVEPVVKQKPQDDLLENIEGSSASSSPSSDSTDTSAAPSSTGTSDDPAPSSSDSTKSDKPSKK
jgi:hypothetical protein